MRVRTPWRQFQARHVTPRSSRQTISPGRRRVAPVELLVADGWHQDDVAADPLDVFAAERQRVSDGDRVIEVDQAVDRGQVVAAGDALEERLRGAGVAARLAAEGGHRRTPGGDPGESAGRPATEAEPGTGLRLAEQPEGVVVGGAVPHTESLHDDGPVGREPFADRIAHDETHAVTSRASRRR